MTRRNYNNYETRQQTGNRDAGVATEEIQPRANERSLQFIVDDVPYLVTAAPFSFNEETRFYVRINGGPEHVFTWDSDLKQLRAIDDEAGDLPDVLEEAISQKLQSLQK